MYSWSTYPPGRRWDPRHDAICNNTAVPIDPRLALQLHTNSCHRAFAPHPSACCLRLSPIYRSILLPGRHAPTLAVSKSNTFAGARPEIDAAPVTILLETPSLLRWSLPPIPNAPVLDTIHTTTCTTFNDYYATTLPAWEQNLLIHATEQPFTTRLYQLLHKSTLLH
jgi:hypothetical protein